MRAIDLDGDAMHRMISRLQTFLNRCAITRWCSTRRRCSTFSQKGTGGVAASCAKPPEAPSPGTAAAAAAAAGKEGGDHTCKHESYDMFCP